MNIQSGAKDAPSSGHRAKKTHPKIQPSSPILGVKWERGMEKCGKNALMLEYVGQCGRNGME
jgi:hypothetical protein